jgi:hypothetical protein
MKARDYLFWTTLTCLSLLAGHWLRSGGRSGSPLEPPHARPATVVEKATYWLALLRLAHGAPRLVPTFESLPDAVVNAPPQRTDGPDGHPLLDHGSGW